MNVLIIDDDEINNFLCKKVMEISGFSQDIHSCQSVDQGIKYLKEVHKKDPSNYPDALFLDINMPIRTGWDFLDEYELLCKEEVLKKMNIYMLSSSVYEEDIKKAEDNPLVTQYVTKPLEDSILLDLEKQILS
jgi:CheY-like chemotaxis protein